MKKISTAELKAHLGKYLGMVKEGETIYITSHRRPVAQLTPTEDSGSLTIYPPTLPAECIKEIKGIKPASEADGVAELLEDRRYR
jgi:prevent-host-death family protein